MSKETETNKTLARTSNVRLVSFANSTGRSDRRLSSSMMVSIRLSSTKFSTSNFAIWFSDRQRNLKVNGNGLGTCASRFEHMLREFSSETPRKSRCFTRFRFKFKSLSLHNRSSEPTRSIWLSCSSSSRRDSNSKIGSGTERSPFFWIDKTVRQCDRADKDCGTDTSWFEFKNNVCKAVLFSKSSSGRRRISFRERLRFVSSESSKSCGGTYSPLAVRPKHKTNKKKNLFQRPIRQGDRSDCRIDVNSSRSLISHRKRSPFPT